MLYDCHDWIFVDFRKFFTSLIDPKPLTPPLHLIIVNQQIFVTKNVTWTMLVSSTKSQFVKVVRIDYQLKN
jgi:hypothetical protein